MRTNHLSAASALRRVFTKESATPPDRVEALTARVEHLEAALEGLQDAVYRQDVVHDRQIADLRKRAPNRPDAGSPELGGDQP